MPIDTPTKGDGGGCSGMTELSPTASPRRDAAGAGGSLGGTGRAGAAVPVARPAVVAARPAPKFEVITAMICSEVYTCGADCLSSRKCLACPPSRLGPALLLLERLRSAVQPPGARTASL